MRLHHDACPHAPACLLFVVVKVGECGRVVHAVLRGRLWGGGGIVDC